MTDAQNTSRLPPVTLDSSQSPQDITLARLPTPSQQTFCEPCKAFLRGDMTECFGSEKWTSWVDHEYIHHLDAKSFQRALELHCAICIRLHKAFQETSEIEDQTTYSMGPTQYYLQGGGVCFKSHDLILWPDLLPYESRPDLHYLHITQNTGDAKALSFLENQYHKCRKQHSKCQRLAPYSSFTPTRTIYVGSAEEEVVRLCDSVEMVAGSAYTVLSHCWGKNPQHVMLSKSNIEMLKEGIALSSLSKTFQDAIAVTRAFQIQYIWIDSLCIFQDDLHDWATEASHMRDVYSMAEICIAATGAESGDVGLFFDRDSEQLTPVRVEVTWPSDDVLRCRQTPGSYLFGFYHVYPGDAIDKAPLNRRAWVAQERFLSPRTLHFTQSLLYWECHKSLTNENQQMPDSSHFNGYPNRLRTKLNEVQRPESNLGSMQNFALCTTSNDTKFTKLRAIYVAWGYFLADYTSCGITKESDILVALVGIADEVGHAMNDCLIAGLWKTRFIEELCWKVRRACSRPSIWRAPSWSWASLSGMIRPSGSRFFEIPQEMAAIVKFHISTKPSGEVERGSVLVECRPISATVYHSEPEDDDDHGLAWGALDDNDWLRFSKELNPEETGLIGVELDVTDATCSHADQAVDVQLLLLLKDVTSSGAIHLHGVCVMHSGNQAGAFERVGYFRAVDIAADSVLAAYDQAQVQEILLV